MQQTVSAALRAGLEHHQAGRLGEAEQCYQRILALAPEHADALHLLGLAAYQAGRAETAMELIRRAIALHPAGAIYHANLGNVLQAGEQLAAAAASYRAALRLKPNLAEVRVNLGHVLQAQGEVEGALAQYRQALQLQPNLAEAAAAEAMALLLQGEYAAGWAGFEQRWRTRDYDTPMRSYAQPFWRGERLAAGERVLLWGEQGIGDEVMFAGLLPDALRTGNSLVLECAPRLVPLFRRSFAAVEVIAAEAAAALPWSDPRPGIGAHLPSGSLPGLFRTSRAAFAATASPYLLADAAEREQLRARYHDGRPLVGLAWSTRSPKTGRRRSLELQELAPLFQTGGVQWVSLQYGEHAALEREAAGTPLRIDRSIDQLADLDAFAAQIAAMDLVITIDNSTAHLAGALGVPTWLLLPFAPNWRWLREGESSPWYPALRLFRQACGGWPSVVEAVAEALAAWVTGKSIPRK
jgi:Tfp pilus assembly protein PilF